MPRCAGRAGGCVHLVALLWTFPFVLLVFAPATAAAVPSATALGTMGARRDDGRVTLFYFCRAGACALADADGFHPIPNYAVVGVAAKNVRGAGRWWQP